MKTMIYDILDPAQYDEAIDIAAKTLMRGGLVVFPTETVYGLGADATNEEAVRRIFEAKGRPQDNPLIVHMGRVEDISAVAAYIPDAASRLARCFMPGPLTLILKKKPIIPGAVSGGLDSVGVRVPSLQAARALILACNLPVAAPSANISGRPSPTTPEDVLSDMDGRVDVILLAGESEYGVESTVLDCTSDPYTILRPGGIGKEQIESVCPVQQLPAACGSNSGPVLSPGIRYRHYKPEFAVTALSLSMEDAVRYLNRIPHVGGAQKDAALVFEEMVSSVRMENVYSLGSIAKPENAAKRLFALFRSLERAGMTHAWVTACPPGGIGDALNNRLFRAADDIVESM